MLKLISKSIAFKLQLVTGVAIALVLALSNLVLISQTRDRVQALTMEQADSQASAIANEVAGDIGELASAARSMAGVLGRGHEAQSFDRKGAINLLKANVEQNAFAFGSWFCEVAQAFDGRKEDTVKNLELAGNDNGVFTPYWSKTQDGGVQFSTFNNDYTQEWFALAAKSGKGAITAPYLAEGTEVPTTMSSIAYPVVSGGKMIGVTGVDISLGSLSEKLQALKPFETGRVMLVGHTGQWLVAPSADLLMKPYDGEGADKLKAALSSGKPETLLNVSAAGAEPFDRLIYPFAVPGVNTTWAVIVDIPESAISAPVEAQTVMMIIGGLVVLCAVMAALYLAARAYVQKPLHAIVADVDRLGAGNYETAVEGQNRTDELGLVAKALEGFRHRLSEGRTLEGEAARQRRAAEDERNRSEAEREESASLQQKVVTMLGTGLSELSNGNLGYRIQADFPGEYAALKADFNAAVASLENAINAVNVSVGAINNGSTEISDSADNLSRRTEQQAASLEETAAALNQLTEQVNSSADNAAIAARTVQLACQDAERSGEVVQRAVTSMHGIEQSSGEISRIIGVIDEIAFQTNLLALNAGVEAARAGEAGKGFAVVAQEVRELAQRSANAAKEIKALITASGAQVKDGVALVGEAGDTLHKIAEQVMQINTIIAEISASATEQASGLKEINTAVHQMDQVTQQNAAMVEETTAASMTLKTEAQNLRSLVTRFRTSGAARETIAPPAYPAVATREPARVARPAVRGGAAAVAVQESWEEF
ncbi:methyl-accepting chemotaxis protein [Ciceribacter sp. RN22]|uniref:methyl-accepting chemotaxis protein n=1 Tax=Ciceribacter sp. RN22 TaxID=2954932 RepID=UPI002092A3AA|nr:methyl-accepting chemotaxis protein [Ciceribacter sp. RN22]MCO6176720.1 methyl-accepting chemotaxis protein [Ciceribacter sp. RN22]